MRRAVEQFTTPPPKIVTDPNDLKHPFNRGLVWHETGSLIVYMFTDAPGIFYKDIHGQKPASDAEARAAFGVADFNRYRAEAVMLDDDRRIEEALTQTSEPEPEVDALEAKKALVRRLAREYAKRVQAAADKALTRHLNAEAPTPTQLA
jgi:hypothetical protein